MIDMDATQSHGEASAVKRPRRDKYISRACRACQRRKSKCSGHDPCLSCQDRGLICTYNTGKRRRRKFTTDVQRRAPTRPATQPDEQRDSLSTQPVGYTTLPLTNMEAIGDVEEPEPLVNRPAHPKPSPSPPWARASLYRSVGCDPNRISLRSQISEVRTLFKTRGDPESDLGEDPYNRGEIYPIELPAFPKIEGLLDVYFVNMTGYYPALHPEITATRIHEILGYLRYPSTSFKVDVDYIAAPTIALLCIMIAISQMAGDSISSSKTQHQAMAFGNHARSLMQTFAFLAPNLEVLRCHTLITIYLLHMDFLDLALQSISVTVRLAMVLQLHRRSACSREGSDYYEQNLWWTIYTLDRHIACLGGTSYLIRDEEIDAPKPGPEGHFERFSSFTYIHHPSEFGKQRGPIEQSFDEEATYLETLAHLGRAWAQIWKDLVEDGSGQDCQLQTAEMLDSQLRALQQRLPPTVIWKGLSSIGRYLEKEEKHATQRQLVVLMRINTLRLFIRRNPASSCTCLDWKPPHYNGTVIAAQTIEAIADFCTHYEALLPIGHPVSTTLVQCILYLVNIIESTNTTRTEAASASVVSAYQILIDLSDRCESARNAVQTLDAAFFHNGDASIRPHEPHYTTATLPRSSSSSSDGSESGRLEDTHVQGLRHLEKQNTGANGLLDCLQQRYGSLDSLLTNSLPNS